MLNLTGETSAPDFKLNFTLYDVNEDLLLVHALITSFIVYCSLPLNIFAMIMLVAERKKFEKGDIFIFAIILANLLGTLLHSGTVPIATLAKGWPFGEVVCKITAASQLVMVDFRQMFLTALSIHRFCNVISPLHYPAKQNWVIIGMFVLIMSNIMITHTVVNISTIPFFDISWPTCDTENQVENSRPLFAVALLLRAVYVGSGLIPLILYAVMWRKAWKLKQMTTVNRNPHSQKQYRILITIYQEKKALFRLLLIFIAGFVITLLLHVKKFNGNSTFGLTENNKILIIHYVFGYITLFHPYFDLITLLSSEDKVTARKSFISKICKKLGLSENDAL